MNIRLFSHAKRPNSTGRPDLNTGHLYDNIQLRGPCSIMSPVIDIRMAAGADPVGFNYAYIPEFERYYFVNDWQNDGYLWTCYLVEDELATWRTAIGASTQYILRSSHSYDGKIVDTLYPTKQDVTIVKNYTTALGTVTGGWYVVGIQNIDSQASGMGSSRYYAFTSGNGINSLMNALFGTGVTGPGWTGFIDDMSNLTDEVFKSLFNPIEYITSCMFIPFQPSIDNNPITSLNYGYYVLPNMTNCYRLDLSQQTAKSGTIDIPRHPQAGTRGAYLNGSPYTRYTLTMQPFGQVTLDPALLLDSDDDKLYYSVIVDPVSGVGTLELSIYIGTSLTIIHSQCAQVGVPVSISQMSRDFMGFATSTLGAAGGAASAFAMGNIPGAAGSVASGIASSITSMLPQIQTQGASGSFAAYFASQPFLRGEFFTLVDEDNADHGRPLCVKGTISSYPGYLLIADPDVSILEANRTEMDAIRNYMSSGFFYE